MLKQFQFSSANFQLTVRRLAARFFAGEVSTSFELQVFQMTLRSGDCLAWRCVHRCDLTFHELVGDEASWWRDQV